MTHCSTRDTPRRRYVTWRDGLCAGILLLLLVSTHWVTVNLSSSMPRGIYRYVRTAAPFQRGEIVHIPAVDFGRSWWASWLALLKPIAGIPGDIVCVSPEGLWVTEITRRQEGNQERKEVFYGAVYEEHKGKALPVFWGCHAVEDGEVFVASHEPRSLDSRYFGPVRIEEARRVVPVVIWR